MEERANLEHPDKEIKDIAPLTPTEPLPQKFTLQTASKSEHLESQKQRKSPKMGRQRTHNQKEWKIPQ